MAAGDDSAAPTVTCGAPVGALVEGLAAVRQRYGATLAGVEPEVSEEAVRQLKFAELLPPDLAHDTLAARAADHAGAARVLGVLPTDVGDSDTVERS